MKAALRRKLSLLLVAALFAHAAPARADDVADEAELQFQLGAERYKTGDYRGALEHFLASNRLVVNRNVIFNIARTYEQMHEMANAHRYYTMALDAETDAAQKRRIQEAIERINPQVAVLKVETDPPGATIYLDRKDLGPRGSSPRALGVASGTYRVIAELEGYEPATSAPLRVNVGTQTPVKLSLKQIVSPVTVTGTPAGAQVRIDREDTQVLGAIPCTLQIQPGRHILYVSQEGFQTSQAIVDVVKDQPTTVNVRLVAITGNLLVNADVRDAIIYVDGQAVGFTPAVLTVPVGQHKVRVQQEGFRPVEQTIEVRGTTQARIDAQLQQIEEVSAASRVTESVEDAPSSVTVIPNAELRAMGYPTIADAIRGIRGVYLSDDHIYQSAGFRGFSRSGDYGNRVLVLVDGMPTNDNYVGSSYIGYDARVDIDDIDRIEVVRGPGSVLYGTGAFFGVINLVTRSRNSPTHAEAALGTANNGVGRARATGQVRLSPDAGFWASAAGAHGSGRDYFFPEYANDTPEGGNARDVDSFDAATTNGRVWFKALTLQWFATSRKKVLPNAGADAVFADPRTHYSDTRALVEARFEPHIGSNLQWLTRVHGNFYEFGGFIAYPRPDGGPSAESFRGVWAGAEERIIWAPWNVIRVTLGGELQRHFLAQQLGNDEQQVYMDRNDPFWVGAGYLVGDLAPSSRFKVEAGSRLDWYSTFGASYNPRFAVIFRAYEQGVTKLLAGKAFRAPSVYELYYTGTTQRPSTDLKPEQISSAEIEHTHRFSPTVTATLAGYANYVTGLVVLRGGGSIDDPNYYTNSSSPVLTMGGELELRREWRQGWMVGASYSYQRSRYLRDEGLLREVPNAPEHLASIRGAVPILDKTLVGMTRLSVEGPRYDRNENVADPPQGRTDPAVIWDLVLSGEAERLGVRYAIGAYNVADWRYSVPVSTEFRNRTVVQNGRTFLASVQVSF